MQISASDFLSQLLSAMESHGLRVIGNINIGTDKIQRFKNANKSGGSKDVFVVVHSERGATFGDWHNRDAWVTWWANKKYKPNINENKRYQEQRYLLQIERDKKRMCAINRALCFWLEYPSDNSVHEQTYIQKKRIKPYYAKCVNFRWVKDLLMIPVRDIDFKFQTIQIIKSNGFKRLWKGTSQKGNMIWLTPKLPENYDGVIRICEGYATGCSIYEATGSPVICAINADNMRLVVTQLRTKYPKAMLKVCADNDQWGKVNTGVNIATQVCNLTGATLYYPEFSSVYAFSKPTDFNDLFCISGMQEVKRQLMLMRQVLNLS